MDKSRRNYKYYQWSFYVVINSIVLATNIQMFVEKGTAEIIPSKRIIFATKNIIQQPVCFSKIFQPLTNHFQ